MSKQLNPIFSVPFYQTKFDDVDTLNAKLKQLFIQKEQEGDAHRNVGAFVNQPEGLYESKFNLFDWQYAEIKELEKKCWTSLYGLIGEINRYDRDTLLRLHIKAESWFHIMRKHSYFSTHCHPMASWSGVYCVDPGDQVSSDSRSGRLEFINPFPAASTYVDMANVRLTGIYETNHVGIQLQAGQLVIFPSWLQHQVLPYLGEKERITVAFNASFMLQGPLPTINR